MFEDIIPENFPNLRKETDIQVQEAQSQTESTKVVHAKMYYNWNGKNF